MRRALTLTASAAAALLLAAVAGAVGELTQKPGTAGCISADSTGGACQDGTALGGARGVALSFDDKSVYVAAPASDALVILDRSPATGALVQKPGLAGCVSETGSGGDCRDGTVVAPDAVAVSPDGKSVYAVSGAYDAVAVFDREPETGALTQKTGTAACVSDSGNGGLCLVGRELEGATAVAVSPDGKNVYIASSRSDAIAIFDRNTATGALAQKLFVSGCVSEDGSAGTCQDGKALNAVRGVAVSADGRNVYAGSDLSDGVAIFDRNETTGALTQKAGAAGCISETGTAGACLDGTALGAPFGLAVSADGRNVYVTSGNSGAVVVLDRDLGTGTLVQKVGAAGCISEDPTLVTCQLGRGLAGASAVSTTADGTSVYVAGRDANAVAIFDRDPATGALAQKAGAAGCVSETGTGGDCQDGTALVEARAVAVSADGRSLYVASAFSSAVSAFDRALPPPATPPPPPPASPPPPPSPPAAVDRTAPVVSGFTVSPRRVRTTARSSFRFRLSERATTRIVIERVSPRRRVGMLTFSGRPAGTNRVVFRPRIAKRALPRGSYRATITATDPAGNRSRPRTAGFRVVRR